MVLAVLNIRSHRGHRDRGTVGRGVRVADAAVRDATDVVLKRISVVPVLPGIELDPEAGPETEEAQSTATRPDGRRSDLLEHEHDAVRTTGVQRAEIQSKTHVKWRLQVELLGIPNRSRGRRRRRRELVAIRPRIHRRAVEEVGLGRNAAPPRQNAADNPHYGQNSPNAHGPEGTSPGAMA